VGDVKTPYQHYADLLRQLHELMVKDQDGSPEAESIRGRMDVYWQQLSEVDLERVRRLSAGLYLGRGSERGECDVE
jgi:hypothetical protein